MCKYLKQNICQIKNNKCPYTYFCDKLNIWRLSKYMPKECPVAKANESKTDKGNKVLFERHGYLYVSIDGQAIPILNPFDYVPQYVRLNTDNGKYIIENQA